jgi:hypothetical protein
MKSLLSIPRIAAVALLCAPLVYGQDSPKKTTATPTTPTPAESASAPKDVSGTVAEWRADRSVLLQKDVTEPVPLSFAKKVEYVDKAGKPVARESIQPGDPVTIHYVLEGDRLLVSRVIVEHKSPSPEPAPVANGELTAGKAPGTADLKPAPKTDAGNVAKEIEKLRAGIEKESRQLGGK